MHFKPVQHHISERDGARLCDGEPASERDIPSEEIFELRDARRDVTLCPDCQDRMHPLDMHLELYGMGSHTTAHLYAVPVLAGFDALRKRYAKGVDELLETTGSRPATIYEYHAGSVAYFAPDAPDFAEAGELKGDALTTARRILDERGLPGGNAE